MAKIYLVELRKITTSLIHISGIRVEIPTGCPWNNVTTSRSCSSTTALVIPYIASNRKIIMNDEVEIIWSKGQILSENLSGGNVQQ
jgi:hypothetical protein